MAITLDKAKETNSVSILASKPKDTEPGIILHFYSTFDSDDEVVTVDSVEQQGSWLIFDVTSVDVPDRSGRYIVEFHTITKGTVPLNLLYEPFDVIESPLDDLESFRKDIAFGKTVGYIKNATNALFKDNGRTIAFKERTTTSRFKEQARDEIYKEQARDRGTFKSQDRDVEFKTNK